MTIHEDINKIVQQATKRSETTPPKDWKPQDGYIVIVKNDGDHFYDDINDAKASAKKFKGRVAYNVDYAYTRKDAKIESFQKLKNAANSKS